MSLGINFITSPKFANMVQNSTFQVASEGCLKAVGRPTFTLMDKTAQPKERKYSAAKEFLYQSLSMASYFALIFPIRKNSFKLLKHFPQLKDLDITKAKTSQEFAKELSNMPNTLAKTKIKGAQELISIIASGVILAVITPQIATKLTHPILNKLISNKKDSQEQ